MLPFFVLTACKKPQADFSFDKNEYVSGETMQLTNLSINSGSVLWELPDGTFSRDENVSYTIPTNCEGSLLIKLNSASKDGKHIDKISKSIDVVPAGQCLFYTQDNNFNISVRLNGQDKTICGISTSIPDFGDSKCANFDLLHPGKYNYYASDGYYVWEGEIQVKSGFCTKFKLYKY